MNSWRFFKEALESLSANKLRTGLTMLGIVIGVAAVVSMIAIGSGASTSITSEISSMGTNLIYVTRNFDNSNPQPLTLADAEAIMTSGGAPAVLAVAPSVQTNRTVMYGGESTSTALVGVTPDYASVRNTNVDIGRFISQLDIDNRATVAVIGTDVVEEVFGSEVGVIGQKLRVGNNLYEVVGILEKSGGNALGSADNQVLVPLTTALTRLMARSSAKDEVNMIAVSAVDSASIESAVSEITSILRSRHSIPTGEDSDFTVLALEAVVDAAASVAGVLSALLGSIAAISLLVGGIGIMNIMLVSVIERTKEIGLRKAVGAKRKDILLQFLVEALIIGLLGGLLGVLLAWGLTSAIKAFATVGSISLNPVITAGSVALAVSFSVAVGLLFGLYPADRASKLEPVEALRTE